MFVSHQSNTLTKAFAHFVVHVCIVIVPTQHTGDDLARDTLRDTCSIIVMLHILPALAVPPRCLLINLLLPNCAMSAALAVFKIARR